MKPARKSARPKGASEALDADPGTPERIAKRMARAGLCSRREAEAWIEAGRVSVNGRTLTTPAHTVTARDRIEVDGAPLPTAERTRLWLLNKRAGTVTTARDPEGRATVFDALPDEMPRTLAVGRLDINTEGLLLLTNDGGLARVLELPSTGWLRRYRVRAHGRVTQGELDRLADGIAVDGVLYGAIEAQLEREQGTNVWLTFAMREGKNREVKKVLSALGLEVNRLIRISYGPFQLGDLASGEVREVRGRTLRDQLGPRLIADAGADFETPPAAPQPAPPRKAQTSGGKAGPGGKVGPGGKDGPRKEGRAQKPKRQRGREPAIDPLSRLDTRPRDARSSDRAGANAGGPGKRSGARTRRADAGKPSGGIDAPKRGTGASRPGGSTGKRTGGPEGGPAREPTRGPAKGPDKGLTKGPGKGSDKGRFKGPSKGPSKGTSGGRPGADRRR